jgi:GAF domain-containing protein
MPETGTDSIDDTANGRFIRHLDEVTGALESLSEVLGQEEELPVILQRLCRQVIHAIPETEMASVTLMRDDGPETAAMTDDGANDIDQAQYRTGQGPCLHAARTGQVVRITVAEVRDRWPDFADAAGGAGVASYLSAPLFIDSEYHGSLNLYGRRPHGYRMLDAALLELYTTAVEAALQGARRYLKAREHAGHLQTALGSRGVIDQAKGIVMGARRISADDAFMLLVEHSQRENIKLHDIAQRLVTGVDAANGRVEEDHRPK